MTVRSQDTSAASAARFLALREAKQPRQTPDLIERRRARLDKLTRTGLLGVRRARVSGPGAWQMVLTRHSRFGVEWSSVRPNGLLLSKRDAVRLALHYEDEYFLAWVEAP